jgi:hypothetical protein
MDIDPRLRALGDGGTQSFDQQSRNLAYSNSISQPPAPHHQSSDSPNRASLTGSQNHTFYPALPTTPQSFYPSTHTSVNSNAAQYDERDQSGVDHAVSRTIQYPGEAGADNNTSRSRACEACRSLKVRCEPDPDNPDAPCKRCAKAGRQCIVTVPNRKRQKKTDSRVAELEKKIDALTASLHASRGQHSSERSDPGVEPSASAYPPPDQSPSAAETARDGWMGQVPGGQDGLLRQSLRGIPTPPAAPSSKRKRSDDTGNYGYVLQSGNLMNTPGPIGTTILHDSYCIDI